MKIKSYLFLIFIVSIAISSSQAQEKINIGVAPFEGATGGNYNKKVTSIILDIFQKNERFKVMDLSGADVVDNEIERQKGEGFIDGFIVEQGRSQGSAIIATGTINALNAIYDDKLKKYRGSFEITLKLFNVEENTVVASAVITEDGRQNSDGKGMGFGKSFVNSISNFSLGSSNGDTEADAINNTLNAVLPKEINAFIRSYFPIEMPIYEIEKKGKKYFALVIGTKDSGLMEKVKMEIFYKQPRQVGERTLYMDKVLGDVKVDNFSGDFIQLKILKNGDAINDAFVSGEHKLLVREKI